MLILIDAAGKGKKEEKYMDLARSVVSIMSYKQSRVVIWLKVLQLCFLMGGTHKSRINSKMIQRNWKPNFSGKKDWKTNRLNKTPLVNKI